MIDMLFDQLVSPFRFLQIFFSLDSILQENPN